jgi:ribosome recycling factor
MSFEHAYRTSAEDLMLFLREDLKSLRTGRATPALLERIPVLAYGEGSVPVPIVQLASISVSSARSIVLQPWDKTVLKHIEKAIIQANLGFHTSNEGDKIRVLLPELTEEQRREYVKILKAKLEDARIKVRVLREKVREDILAQEKGKEISEDEKFRQFKKLEEITKEYSTEIDEIGRHKEEEIMSV